MAYGTPHVRGLLNLALLLFLACDADRQGDRDAEHQPVSHDASAEEADGGRAELDGGTSAALDGGSDRTRDASREDAAANGSAADAGMDAARDSGTEPEAHAALDAGKDSAASDAGWEAAALPSLTGVDLSLGGLNQDLAPSGDCLENLTTAAVCLDLLGEFNGQRFDHCNSSSQRAGTGLGSHGFGCYIDLPSGGLLELSVTMESTLIGKLPSTFSFAAPPDSTKDANVFVGVTYDGGQAFSSSQAREDGNVTTEVRISAVAGYGPGAIMNVISQFERGSFALTMTPTASCSVASRCPRVRIRGNFTARTVFEVFPRP